MSREAMQLALELIEPIAHNSTDDPRGKAYEAITAIREALAEPEQEPAAWMVYTQDGQSVYVTDNPTDIQKNQRALPMYTAPKREWVGLTDADIDMCLRVSDGSMGRLIGAIEVKLREKNT